MHTLEIDSVKLSYSEKIILSDIYLKVTTGEIIGILGRNGCGKSTLLKLLFGLLSPENKSVRLDGIYQPTLYKIKKSIKYLPQHSFLPIFLTVNQALNIFVEKPEEREEILKIDSIKKLKNQRLADCSGGEKRFVEVVLLLCSDSQFVLLDEPFSHISPIQIEVISEILKRQVLIKGIIITDHMFEYVLELSNKKYLLQNGKLHLFHQREDLIDYGYLN